MPPLAHAAKKSAERFSPADFFNSMIPCDLPDAKHHQCRTGKGCVGIKDAAGLKDEIQRLRYRQQHQRLPELTPEGDALLPRENQNVLDYQTSVRK